jgi:ribosomal protein S6--L-glutamate ligase
MGAELMDICLLTRFHSNHQGSSFVQRLADEGTRAGITLHLVNPAEVMMTFDGDKVPVRYQGKPFPRFDLIHYALRWDDDHTWDIIETLKGHGYPTLPSQRMPLGDGITMARLFARHNIRTPRTWVLSNAGQLSVVLGELSFPCLFRVRKDGKGRGVQKINGTAEALRVAEQLGRSGYAVQVQEIMQPTGLDVRAVVVADKILAAVERTATAGHLRPAEDGNPAVAATVLTPAESAMVLAAARLYSAPYAAVNFLRRDGEAPVLLEVARAPVLTEVERATGGNIAAAIIAHLITVARQYGKQPAAMVAPAR